MKNQMLNGVLIGLCVVGYSTPAVAETSNLYLSGPVVPNAIGSFENLLGLTKLSESNEGLNIQGRRQLLNFLDNPTESAYLNQSQLDGLNSLGRLDAYLYKALTTDDKEIAGNLTLGTGTSGSSSNLPLILDLGDKDLLINGGTLQAQGAALLTTVNSFASSEGLRMDGLGSLEVDPSKSGQIKIDQLVELGAGQAQFKLIMDLNTTLKNDAAFDFLVENRPQQENETSFLFSGQDSLNSNLFDTSYVINSSAKTTQVNGQQKVTITFNRQNDEYIRKSFTRNHPSNDAALKLGAIAADGVALGDMQTVLTRLDINDFGYGNNAENLAIQVKRLAPVANNSFVISSFDGVKIADGVVDYRIASRRGNWSGYSDLDHSFWLRGVASSSNSSGSVPRASDDSQDTAGHDGFKTSAQGIVMGVDKVIENLTVGAAFSNISTEIKQLDDRNSERSKLSQNALILYGQWRDMSHYINATVKYADGDIFGWRRTAIDRTADYDFSVVNTEFSFKAGKRFDLSNGRSAIAPYIQLSRARYKQSEYEEYGAGDLSLHVSELKVDRTSMELGLSMSHKGRIKGVKALTVFDVAVGSDVNVSDQTVHARYTGKTHTVHPNYTAFTTPSENWATNYVDLQFDLQLEVKKGMMFKWGVDAELRQGRQMYSSDLSLNWVF